MQIPEEEKEMILKRFAEFKNGNQKNIFMGRSKNVCQRALNMSWSTHFKPGKM